MARPRKITTGTMTADKIRQYAETVRSQKSDMDETRGELAATMKQFEEDGGHRQALKLALKIGGMDSTKAQAFWASLREYLEVLGIADQQDLFRDVSAGLRVVEEPHEAAAVN